METVIWWALTALLSLAVLITWLYLRTRAQLDDIHQETKGVRTRLERHSDDSSFERNKMRSENRTFQSRIYAQFVEWLQFMKGGK